MSTQSTKVQIGPGNGPCVFAWAGVAGHVLSCAGFVVAAAFVASSILELPGGFLPLGLANFALLAGVVLVLGWQQLPARGFGLANGLTLARGGVVALLAATLPYPDHAIACADVLASAAAVALLFDAVDGWWARRSNTASRFGARFDMEMDALAVLVLAALVFATGRAGGWVLIGGVLRYAFVAAGALWPRLGQPLPPSRRRRALCAVQVVTLIAALGPWLSPDLAAIVAGAGVALLGFSFALDVLYLVSVPPVASGPPQSLHGVRAS